MAVAVKGFTGQMAVWPWPMPIWIKFIGRFKCRNSCYDSGVDRAKLNTYLPKQPYIVINVTENKFWLYNAKHQLVSEGVCSTGSQVVLDNGSKQWEFKTPKGVRRINNKVKDPVWTRPDWAFIEEGLPVPGPRHPSRLEYGVLGDYALHMGDGYMIHGTIYQRFLGMPVTHGCVRLGDKELADVYKTLVIGSRVFVY
jgi:L,D-transpeptidase ErfK/SrfK